MLAKQVVLVNTEDHLAEVTRCVNYYLEEHSMCGLHLYGCRQNTVIMRKRMQVVTYCPMNVSCK